MIRAASLTFAFEPELFQAVHRAFEAVCAKLQLSMGSEDRVTELVGEKIIELAQTGEHDADRLAARVLAEFGIDDRSLTEMTRHRAQSPAGPATARHNQPVCDSSRGR
jgi:hypothetical protein